LAQAAFGCKLRPAFALPVGARRLSVCLPGHRPTQRHGARLRRGGHGKRESFVLIGLSKSEAIGSLTR